MALIDETLGILGFKEEEARTYLSLLDVGATSGSNLAKKIGMPRPTVYGYLERLVAGGLVSQSMRRGVKIYTAEPGEKIRQLYRRKIEDLKSREKGLDELIPELERRTGASLMRPRIQIFEGRDGIETALQDMHSYSDLYMKAFWSVKSEIEVTSDDFVWFHNKERIKRNLSVQGLWPATQVVDIRKHPYLSPGPELKRELRVAAEGIESSMGYWIYANKVLFASSRLESFCFIIESEELVEMMTNQFDVIWATATPVITDPSYKKPFLDDLYRED